MKGNKLTGTVLTSGGANDRRELDFYPTPPEATISLMKFLSERYPLKTMVCTEPACGNGIMSDILHNYFRAVRSSDIISYGYCEVKDYLISGEDDSDALITNPPFALSEKFIRKAMSEDKVIVAMLLKGQYWHSKKRSSLFFDSPPAFVLPLTWRPDFYFGEKSGSPTMEVAWNVWIKGESTTIYKPLLKP